MLHICHSPTTWMLHEFRKKDRFLPMSSQSMWLSVLNGCPLFTIIATTLVVYVLASVVFAPAAAVNILNVLL